MFYNKKARRNKFIGTESLLTIKNSKYYCSGGSSSVLKRGGGKVKMGVFVLQKRGEGGRAPSLRFATAVDNGRRGSPSTHFKTIVMSLMCVKDDKITTGESTWHYYKSGNGSMTW